MKELPIAHPEIERVAAENALLREELSGLLAEVEQLTQVVKPNLLALYQTKIGAWELRLLEAQGEFARLRREVELIQASLNRGQPPDLHQIEGLLGIEFLAWQQRVREAAKRLDDAAYRLNHPMPPEENREFKKLHRALVKRLHPDVNPELTEAQRTLWNRVQSAYAASDLNGLRALLLLAEEAAVAPPPNSLEVLRAARATLSKQITALLARIERIQQEPPFTLKQQLQDETWVAARRQDLEVQLKQVKAQTQALAAHRQQLLTKTTYGAEFGAN